MPEPIHCADCRYWVPDPPPHEGTGTCHLNPCQGSCRRQRNRDDWCSKALPTIPTP